MWCIGTYEKIHYKTESLRSLVAFSQVCSLLWYWFNLFSCFKSILVFYFFLSNFDKPSLHPKTMSISSVFAFISLPLLIFYYEIISCLLSLSVLFELCLLNHDMVLSFSFFLTICSERLFFKSFQRTYFWLWWFFPFSLFLTF